MFLLKPKYSCMLKILLYVVLIFNISPLYASSAKLLLNACDPEDKVDSDIQAFHKAGCVFFIRGVMDAHNTFVAVRKIKPIFCPPETLTFDTIERIYLNWIQINQDKLDWTASDSVYTALADNFPCSSQAQ
jgi:hypothetical protein